MKNNGFTLAEVLITIGLLGIVAAMTLPTLNVNIMREQVGPKLAKAINTLENANRLILQDQNVRSLERACAPNAAADIAELSGAMYLQCLVDYTAGTYQNTTGQFGLLRGTLTLKDGITYDTALAHARLPIRTNPNRLRKYSGEFVEITVDINGDRAPNEMGRDRFQLWVDYYGAVIAVGSREQASYTGNSGSLWTNRCNRESQPSANCTGSIVDNGYRVIYQYH